MTVDRTTARDEIDIADRSLDVTVDRTTTRDEIDIADRSLDVTVGRTTARDEIDIAENVRHNFKNYTDLLRIWDEIYRHSP